MFVRESMIKTPVNPLEVALAGAASLFVSQGIGRFAFTPLLPLMLHDGIIDVRSGSLLATANYVGYLVGALLVAAQPWVLARSAPACRPSESSVIKWGLLLTAILTAGMAWDLPILWLPLRFVTGAVCAYVLIFTSAWCLAHLARHDRTALSGVVYSGPGIGIAASGLFATTLVSRGFHAWLGWLVFGAASGLLTAVVWNSFRGNDGEKSRLPLTLQASHIGGARFEIFLLLLAYGLGGFGYIITATFLPVIARQVLPHTIWIDLFWPIFGLGTVVGASLSIFVSRDLDRRGVLIGSYACQTFGVALTLFQPSVAGFVVGSFLVGLPFALITLLVMQEARRLRPERANALMGSLTAVFGIGQIAGPALVGTLFSNASSRDKAFSISLTTAIAALVIATATFPLAKRLWPLKITK
ncbi:MAG: YbfB/YjiJ family MFS transporter [Bradyrhizobiaceae bacterium]|nr:MAG: YbfB/YjiJ family MFS transporter [Bradyrhizobiaceae bacterium]